MLLRRSQTLRIFSGKKTFRPARAKPPFAGRRLKAVTPPRKNHESQATPGGPSWSLMLFLIFLAMLLATGIAWAFTHKFLPHH